MGLYSSPYPHWITPRVSEGETVSAGTHEGHLSFKTAVLERDSKPLPRAVSMETFKEIQHQNKYSYASRNIQTWQKYTLGLPSWLRWLKNPPEMLETRVRSLGWGRSPGGRKGNPLLHSCLEHPTGRGEL